MNNVFIERLLRRVKYEGVLLWEPKDGLALRQILKNWRNYQELQNRKPAEVAAGNPNKIVA